MSKRVKSTISRRGEAPAFGGKDYLGGKDCVKYDERGIARPD